MAVHQDDILEIRGDPLTYHDSADKVCRLILFIYADFSFFRHFLHLLVLLRMQILFLRMLN